METCQDEFQSVLFANGHLLLRLKCWANSTGRPVAAVIQVVVVDSTSFLFSAFNQEKKMALKK